MENVLYSSVKRVRHFEFCVSKSSGSLIIFNDRTNIVYQISKESKESLLEQLDEGLFHEEAVDIEFEDESDGRLLEVVRQGNWWFLNEWKMTVADALELYEFLERDIIAKPFAAYLRAV